MKKRVGDTLIEVTLAIGIFSMVAISIVAVMNGGTSSAQTALETTLAREEIDTQAEALRFIHHAYISNLNANSDSDESNNEYVNLWRDITAKAISLDSAGGSSDDAKALITGYEPTTCDNIYGSDGNGSTLLDNHAFIIDPRSMTLIEPSSLEITPTYPRLLFESDSDSLLEFGNQGDFNKAQGIYVLAVKDPDSTSLIDAGKTEGEKKSAYYDFYIRTCWYGNGDEFPSSISTIVRLYDPDPIASTTVKASSYITIKYNLGGHREITNGPSSYRVYPGYSVKLTAPTTTDNPAWTINNFYVGDHQQLFQPGNYTAGEFECSNQECTFTAPSELENSRTITIYADYQHEANMIYYSLSGATGPPAEGTPCYLDQPTCEISRVVPTYEGRTFLGYTTERNSDVVVYEEDEIRNGIIINRPETDITLYAYWLEDTGFTNVEWGTSGNNSTDPKKRCNIIVGESSIYMEGNYYGPVNCSEEFSFGRYDAFELSATLNLSTFSTHPSGLMAVSVGPIVVIFKAGNSDITVSYGYLPVTKSLSLSDASYPTNYTRIAYHTANYTGPFSLKLTKEGQTYTVETSGTVKSSRWYQWHYITEETTRTEQYSITLQEGSNGKYSVKSGDKTLASGLNSSNLDTNLKVKYTMIHDRHSCNRYFKATLSDISMRRWIYGQ